MDGTAFVAALRAQSSIRLTLAGVEHVKVRKLADAELAPGAQVVRGADLANRHVLEVGLECVALALAEGHAAEERARRLLRGTVLLEERISAKQESAWREGHTFHELSATCATGQHCDSLA